ncbi:uncharacterized protein DUF2750 [Chryseobacterium sp. 52]|uniref:DUF2750 domain-containing protein n=1 Tax=Chryseobacterium sp. 52 TaxID=2035213 RepID=UPI000C1A263E|nr:DUF2750 domain-containing protein [Chryseobacterium sp. 52]PIF46140.1 uncharacterized protein DUF2750 [Chryseobacterium sp. 52]
MLQDQITIKNRHTDFIKKVCESNTVYALKGDQGYATSYSNEMEDEDGEAVQIVCFWSDEARAKSCIEGEWIDYQIDTLSLNSFVENWCLGLNNDGLIIGTNFDNHLFGFEIEPLEIILEIIEELKKNGKSIRLNKFDSILDMENQIREVLND